MKISTAIEIVIIAALAGCSSNQARPPLPPDAVIYHRAISPADNIVGMIETIIDESGQFYKKSDVLKGVAGMLASIVAGNTYTKLPAGNYEISFTCKKKPAGTNDPLLLSTWVESIEVLSGQEWRLVNRISPIDQSNAAEQVSEMEKLLNVSCRPYLKEMTGSLNSI